MPFIQRENIALFLSTCEKPPLSLPAHDRFLTVDLYDGKDPAQVLQGIAAFSRAANRVEPSKFPSPIGAKSRGGVVSPQVTGQYIGTGYNRGREVSAASNASSYKPASLTAARTGGSDSGRRSPSRFGPPTSPKSVSSWSKKSDEGATEPAWNIAQYGYMGGASQGNMGVSFGGRRQITNAAPHVPSLAEKEKKRREKEAEDERLRLQAEEEERQRVVAEEQKARLEEERRFAEETEKLRQKTLDEKREWEEEERRWKAEEDRRKQDEADAETRAAEERKRLRGNSDTRLQGQFLSQYQAENASKSHRTSSSEADRIRLLENELAEARDRELQYQAERVSKHQTGERQVIENHDLTLRLKHESSNDHPKSRGHSNLPARKDSDETWRQDERDYLRKQWSSQNTSEDLAPPVKPPRPLPGSAVIPVKPRHTGESRPLQEPTNYTSPTSKPANRTDRFLFSNPPPTPPRRTTTYSNEIGTFSSNAERDAEDCRRVVPQTKTKAGGWASKSLLEKEMEMERQRQQEWEESQKELKSKVLAGDGVDGIGGGIGGKWDVNQWTGYTGGDGQNRGNQGIGAGRRQIVGPRPPPS